MWAVVVFLCTATLSHSLQQDVDPPVFQTRLQRQTIAGITENARALSENATRSVLRFLDGSDFRSALSPLAPHLASLPSAELLEIYQQGILVSEIAHGFPAIRNFSHQNALDIDLSLFQSAEWFYNQWQLAVLFPERETKDLYDFLAFLAPAAQTEVGSLHMPSFSRVNPFGADLWAGGYPKSLAEASDRVVYGILNHHRLDLPVFLWGNIAAVFNNTIVHPTTFLAPYDTGDYSADCNTTFTDSFCAIWTNSSACNAFWFCQWNHTACSSSHTKDLTNNCNLTLAIGTPSAPNHLLLPFAEWYGGKEGVGRVAQLLARSATPWLTPHLNFTSPHFDWYYEANMLANPPIPTAIRFVIASLPDLFGTHTGLILRSLCRSRTWPLFWALGPSGYPTPPGSEFPPSFPASSRLLDPGSLLWTNIAHNMSVPAGSDAIAMSVWERVRADREGITTLRPSDFQRWWRWLESALSPELLVEPLMPFACQDTNLCVGTVVRSGDCVCVS